ncbi:hypothetical protein Tco_0673627 [Tanacetum coccineum]
MDAAKFRIWLSCHDTGVITRDFPSKGQDKLYHLESTVQQKEETFQVIIDFWYTIKKVKDSESYEFLLANKKCIVDVEVFKKILDICPRVEGEEFTPVQDNDDTLTFLTDLGYKGLLYKYNMYVDHMHQPWRTLTTIINKCLSGKTASNDRLRKSRIDIILITRRRENQDAKLCHYPDSPKLKFVIIGDDYQEYRLAIPDMMLNNAIKQSESYQMFIKYSTSQIPHKKSRGKGSQGKKTADTLVADVEVSEESNSELTRKRTASRRVVKKKVTISIADNTIPDLDVALELEQEAAYIMQALTESKKTSRRQPCTRGSSEGTGVSPRVPDESIVVPATSSEGTDSEYSEEDQGNDEEVDWIDSNEDEEKKDDTDDDKSIDLEMTDDEETYDEFVHGVEQVNDDEDEEMTNAEVEESGNGDEENIDAEKTDDGKTEEVKDDAKKAELPPTSSSLSPLVPTPIPVTPLVAHVTSLLTPSSVSTIPPVPHQTTTPLPTPPITTDALTITTDIPESDGLSAVQLRVARLEKFMSELKKIDHSARALVTLKSQVPTVVEKYLGSKIGDDLQKVLQRHTADLIHKYSVKPAPESSKIQTLTINLKLESEKSALEILKIKKEQSEK